MRKGEWIKASLEKVEKLKPIAERNDLTITELSMKFIMSKKGFASVFPTVVSEEEIVNYVEMTKGGYISASDMKEIEDSALHHLREVQRSLDDQNVYRTSC